MTVGNVFNVTCSVGRFVPFESDVLVEILGMRSKHRFEWRDLSLFFPTGFLTRTGDFFCRGLCYLYLDSRGGCYGTCPSSDTANQMVSGTLASFTPR